MNEPQPPPRRRRSNPSRSIAGTGHFGFIPLGIGDIFSTRHYPTSFVLLLGNERVMIDCPAPLSKILHEASVRTGIGLAIGDIRHIILTHLHADHSSGLESLGFHAKYGGGPRATIWTLPEIRRDLWSHRLRASMAYDLTSKGRVVRKFGLKDYFDVRTISPEVPTTLCGAEIRIRITRHAPICFGLKVFYAGHSLGYSSDTTYDPDHIAFLEECELIIHETGSGIHTSYDSLAALPAALRRRMRLVHVADDFDTARSAIPVLEEGRYYELGCAALAG